jgi:predicted acylesterase/phospholipase RssA
MKTALVVSGGGSRGAFAVGVLEVLRERGWEFDIISGTSTGALIASLASIGDIDELVRIYTSVRTKDILRLNWRRLFKDAIYDTKPLEKLIRKTMKGDRYERLMAAQTTTLFCRIALRSGNILYGSQRAISGHEDVVPWGDFNGYVKALLSSTNEPLFMPPIEIDGQTCLDGGVREVVPFRIVKSLGAHKVVVIANGPVDPAPTDKSYSCVLDTGFRAIDLMTTEITNDDLVGVGNNVTVIRPTAPLPGSSLEFIPEEMQELRTIGQNRAREVLSL